MAAGEVVCLEVVLFEFQARLGGRDEVAHDDRRRHLAEAHEDELHEVDVDPADQGLEPDADGDEVEEKDERDDANSDDDKCSHDVFMV